MTYSVAPDGTAWNGTTDALNATMTREVGPAWTAAIDRALDLWTAAAPLLVSPVADDGSPEGSTDQGVGMLRIGGYDFGDPATLARTYYPSPGSPLGGDVTINTGIDWSTVDLASCLAHEFGHALGLGHASDPGDVMFPSYQGNVTALGLGDVAGIQSIYGVATAPQPVFNMPPAVNAGGNASVATGQLFARVGTFADVDPDSWSATVDYGDGSGAQPLPLNPDKTFTLSHVYSKAGTYTVSVTIGDGKGQGRGFLAVQASDPPSITPAPPLATSTTTTTTTAPAPTTGATVRVAPPGYRWKAVVVGRGHNRHVVYRLARLPRYHAARSRP